MEKRDLQVQVKEYITQARLTLGEAVKPRLLEVDGGGFYMVLLEEDPCTNIRETPSPSI